MLRRSIGNISDRKVNKLNTWKTVKVGELGKIVTGKTPKTSISENYGGSIPFLTPSDDMSVKYVDKTIKTLTERGLSEVKNAILPPNTVCVSCIGSDLGKVVITTQNTVTNQQINSIIVDTTQFDVSFVYYAMLVLGKELNFISKTSTAVPIVNKSSFSSYEIKCPTLEQQKKISSILSAMDLKIECNQKINDNLLQQAQALYGKFFPYDVADELPAGWRVGTVGEIVEIHDSKRIPLSGAQRAKMEKRIYPYYGAASLMDYVDEYIFDGIYLLLGEDGTVVDDAGYPILQYVWGQFWVNNHAHILTGKLGFNVESLLLLFKRTPVKSIVTGAVQPKISQANLRSVQVVIPPQPELDVFNELIRPMFDQIRQNQDQNKSLAAMRDALLPKLMSGEVDVSAIQI